MTNLILSGGSGTGLWSISRTLMPRQIVKLFNDESLFQLTGKRNQTISSYRGLVLEVCVWILEKVKKDI